MTELATFARTLLAGLAVNSVYAALLAGLVMAALRVAAPRDAVIHEAAWALVLLRLVLPPSLHSPLSLRASLDLLGLTRAGVTPGGVTLTATLGRLGPDAAHTSLTAADVGWLVALALWACGIAAGGAWLIVRVRRFHRIAAAASPITDRRLLDCAAIWRTVWKVRRPVRLVTSDACLSPFTTGLRWPVVYLPAAVLAWPLEKVEPIIAHEMTHVSRWDEARIVLANLVALIHFVNPLVWVAVSRLARAREWACDQRALSVRRLSSTGYAQSLLAVLRLAVLGPPPPQPVMGLANGKENVTMRIKEILSNRESRPARLVAALAVIAVAACLLLPMAGAATSEPPAPTAAPAASAAPATPATPAVPATAAAPATPATPAKPPKPAAVKLTHDMTQPRLVNPVQPVYPEAARKARTEGIVILDCQIGNDGKVGDVKAVQGQPDGLTEAAIAAVQQWRYEPAKLKGKPVAVYFTVTVKFTLEPSEEPSSTPTT
jgi:TonB family protein